MLRCFRELEITLTSLGTEAVDWVEYVEPGRCASVGVLVRRPVAIDFECRISGIGILMLRSEAMAN